MDQRCVVGSADEVRRFAPLPRTVYLVITGNVIAFETFWSTQFGTGVTFVRRPSFVIARSALSIRAAHQILLSVS